MSLSLALRAAQQRADQLLALPSVGRARLAELLLASFEDRDPGAGEEGDEEIDRRAADLASGRCRILLNVVYRVRDDVLEVLAIAIHMVLPGSRIETYLRRFSVSSRLVGDSSIS